MAVGDDLRALGEADQLPHRPGLVRPPGCGEQALALELARTGDVRLARVAGIAAAARVLVGGADVGTGASGGRASRGSAASRRAGSAKENDGSAADLASASASNL